MLARAVWATHNGSLGNAGDGDPDRRIRGTRPGCSPALCLHRRGGSPSASVSAWRAASSRFCRRRSCSRAGTLFRLGDAVKVSALLSAVNHAVAGRLLVFFPGEHEGNSYRLLDARDGWNYLAIPITANGSGR